MTPHITNIDYLSREIDPSTGNLLTERLITCKQNVPEFFMKLFGGQNVSYVFEKSVVDVQKRLLVLKSTNLSYAHILTVEEICKYESISSESESSSSSDARDDYSPTETEWTKFTQEARIRSWSGWSYLRESLEDFSISRFQANAHKGRAALDQVIQDLVDDTRNLLKQKFGEDSLVDQILRAREDLDVEAEATSMAEEAIVGQE